MNSISFGLFLAMLLCVPVAFGVMIVHPPFGLSILIVDCLLFSLFMGVRTMRR